ncbi:MAG: HalOD1 output domain-containing protein [Haloferacaceae archaeon]
MMAVEPLDDGIGTEATSDGPVGHARVGEDADRPSVAVVEAVTRATGERPEAGALYRAIDPDALDALFAARTDGSARDDGTVSFVVAGCVVAVHSDGKVTAAVV